MRLTSVTLAFIFFGTVFATPINTLRGNAVEISKRSGEGEAMPGLADAGGDGGDGGGDPPQSPITRGRGSTRQRGGRNKGKGRADPATTGGDSDTGVSPSGKRTKSQGSRSNSNKRTKSASGSRSRGNLVNKATFLAALRDINPASVAGVGSQSLGVYHLNGPVGTRQAVVKIIDDRVTDEHVRTEAARLNHVGQLLAWGRRKTAPRLYYLLMENMGERVDKMEGLDPTTIDGRKANALKQQQDQHKLTHSDPEGNDNYMWKHNKDAAPGEDPYTVNVIDWAGATPSDPNHQYASAPTLYEVPNGIYAPKESPKTSNQGSNSPSDGSTTPPKRTASKGHSGTRSGLRSGGGTSGQGTSGQ